jgi:hypothetical protein
LANDKQEFAGIDITNTLQQKLKEYSFPIDQIEIIRDIKEKYSSSFNMNYNINGNFFIKRNKSKKRR